MDMLERGFVAMAATCLVILVGLTTLLALSPEDSVPEKVLQTLTAFQPTLELALARAVWVTRHAQVSHDDKPAPL